mmetsp:Transcript_22619/g.57541  ORF Transcript_22619/g.57541 Transcript_22619/m.57541 type:complete len:448 (-) Transcript_22619:311-1654(-)
MMAKHSWTGTVLYLTFAVLHNRISALPSASQLASLKLPQNFSISVIPHSLPSARSLVVSGNNGRILYVSTNKQNVYVLVQKGTSGAAASQFDKLDLLASMDNPNGIAWAAGDLFVSGFASEQGKSFGFIRRYRGVDRWVLDTLAGKSPAAPTWAYVTRSLPPDRQHGSRYMRWGPDKLLYLSIGAPCNVCPSANFSAPDGQRVPYASIVRINVTSGVIQPMATGVRNAVGITFHPDTKAMWFTNNGRDGIGGSNATLTDDAPDDYIAAAPAPRRFFGFPLCHPWGTGDPYKRDLGAGRPAGIPDPDHNANSRALNCAAPNTWTRPVQVLGPHTAPLGMWIYRSAAATRGRGKPGLPMSYNRAVLVAEHGSWNRRQPIGYRVSMVRLGSGTGAAGVPRANSLSVFIDGFRTPSAGTIGRPVDVAQLGDGSVVISDDQAGCVYRVVYNS